MVDQFDLYKSTSSDFEILIGGDTKLAQLVKNEMLNVLAQGGT